MLRDGQFLREDPINIGGSWCPEANRRREYTPEEVFMQKALLGEEPTFRLPIPSVGFWLVVWIATIHLGYRLLK